MNITYDLQRYKSKYLMIVYLYIIIYIIIRFIIIILKLLERDMKMKVRDYKKLMNINRHLGNYNKNNQKRSMQDLRWKRDYYSLNLWIEKYQSIYI